MFTTDSFDGSMPFGSSLLLQSCIHSVSVIATASRGRISLGGDLDALRPDIATPGRRSSGGEGARNGLKRRPGNFTTPGGQKGGALQRTPPLTLHTAWAQPQLGGHRAPRHKGKRRAGPRLRYVLDKSARTVCYG